MSRLRPTLNSGSHSPCPDTFDSYYMIRDAVERRRGLIHGALRNGFGVCAIGAFFDDNPHVALQTDIVDEVAAYNDSLRKLTPYQRRTRVLRWLTAKLAVLGWKPARRRKLKVAA